MEKILSKDEYSLFKGEPKQPMNAFNFFIKKLSSEQKIDFKTAVQAYRNLSKEEKDVYIEMSRKAKVQYKHDLATYLFSLPPDDQAQYLNKLETPKRTRVKKEKVVNAKNDDDVDEDIEDDEEIVLQNTVQFEHTQIPANQIEVIATQDTAEFDSSANPIEVIDVYTIKTEFDPLPTNNDHQETTAINTVGATPKTPPKSKASDKVSKSKAAASKSLETSKLGAGEPSKGDSTQSEAETPRKSASKSSSQVTDDESITSNEKKKDKSHKRKRKEEENVEKVEKIEEVEDVEEVDEKKIKLEIEEPTRVPS